MRKIAVVTTSRADFGHLYWPLYEIHHSASLELQLIVTGAHLSPEFGSTVEEVERSGFPIADRLECLVSSDSDVGMAKTIGMATLGIADSFARLRPDLLLLIADRYEMLAPASVALAMRIPIAHIEGGDVSEGAIDHAVRNALTMMSHIHFAPTAKAAERLRRMGEAPWRIHLTGAPSLDHLIRSDVPDSQKVLSRLGIPKDQPFLVVAIHPVTLERDTLVEINEVLGALREIAMPVVFCFPNADAGSRDLVVRAREYCDHGTDAKLVVNLPHLEYWALLRQAAAIVGNSSSGIMESPSIPVPCVNVGIRQQGRERAANIIDAPASSRDIVEAIRKGVSSEFRRSIQGVVNPYGDGQASKKIVNLLQTIELNDDLMRKQGIDCR